MEMMVITLLLVSIGDNFAVNAEEGNEEGVEFYILLCTKTNFIIEEFFTYPWGQRFHDTLPSSLVNPLEGLTMWKCGRN
jgi:hypothetical protein